MEHFWSSIFFLYFFLVFVLFVVRAFVICQASPSFAAGSGLSLSVRDLLSWTGFITSSLAVGTSVTNTDEGSKESASGTGGQSDDQVLKPWEAFVHGAALVLLDGLGLGSGVSVTSVRRLRAACAAKLAEQVKLTYY